MSLTAIIEATRRIQTRVEANPLDHIQWTPPQREFLDLHSPVGLFRSGNQFGKTTVGLAKKLSKASAERRPGETWIVCTSWSQSVSIMRKFHDLCPADWIDDRRSSNFNIRNGYGKDNPAVITHWGWVFRFRTTNQGPEALQGATIDDVLIDEPTAQDIFRELERRVMRTGGRIDMTMTPANRDCSWQRSMVDDGHIEEVHARLTLANLTPIGAAGPMRLLDGTPMDQAWIDTQWRKTPSHYAGVVLDGDWDMRPEGAFFDRVWDRDTHVHPHGLASASDSQVFSALGLDYAAARRVYGQCAALTQVMPWRDDKGHHRQGLYVAGEVVVDEDEIISNRIFAKRIIEMLGSSGVQWRELYRAHGDNPVRSRFVQRSNIETMKAVARELGLRKWSGLQPRILSVKEGTRSAGTVDTGCRYLYEAMADGLFAVHPKCKLTIDAIETWDGTDHHPAKDRIDAIRYSLKPWIFPRGVRSRQTLVVA